MTDIRNELLRRKAHYAAEMIGPSMSSAQFTRKWDAELEAQELAAIHHEGFSDEKPMSSMDIEEKAALRARVGDAEFIRRVREAQ